MTKFIQLLRSLPLALIACSAMFFALSAGIASAHVHDGHGGQTAAGAGANHTGKLDDQTTKSKPLPASASQLASYTLSAPKLSMFQPGNSTWADAQPQSCGGSCLTLCGSSVCHCMQGAVVDLRVSEPRRSAERHAISCMRPLATFPQLGLERPPKA